MKNEKSYNPNEFENQIYKMWEEKNCFYADSNSKKPAFCVIMPPPNVTSVAHIGHAMDMTLQDILIRYKRMNGYEALWLPGADHAALATEVKLVEKLKSENKTKEMIGRDAFEQFAWEWYNHYGDAIMKQFRRMGFSCDWSKYRFTMDESSSNAVLEAFIQLYNKGLIYRGARLTNWCPTCKSAISDEEVEYSDELGAMYHIRYPYADGSGYIIVATTRPETLFGDMAVAVNPEDERYVNIVGKELLLPLTDRKILVIADSYVEKEFGTGMVKITPAHDPNDYEVGKRHNLKVLSVIEKDGTMASITGKYAKMPAEEARKAVIEDLKTQGLLEKVEPYNHSVGHCERCKHIIEPLVTEQWFVSMKQLAKPAIECVKDGRLQIFAKRFEKNYFRWLENIQDWCISRQIWTGHRIPIYTCEDCGNVYAEKGLRPCPKCGSTKVSQDEDVLDTWFSSALWPFSTLGWPNKTKEFEKFYPTDVLVTGYDILTHWVTKMVYMGLECAGDVPFKYTLIHGLVRDEQGRKMSKSLGNGIDPIKVADEYGADALRLALVKDMSLGLDTRMGNTKLNGSKAFVNKLWNASKYVAVKTDGVTLLPIDKCQLTLVDKWILESLNSTIKKVRNNFDKFDLGVALSNVYDFVLDDFCDYYIEFTKQNFYGDERLRQNTASVLQYVLNQTLKLLHPFIPYVTEYIYGKMNDGEILCTANFPEYYENLAYSNEYKKVVDIIELVKNIRQTRLQNNIPAGTLIDLQVKSGVVVDDFISNIMKMAGIREVLVVDELSGASIISPIGEFAVKLEINQDKVIENLKKELNSVIFEIERSEKMLNNANFVAKAPEALVAKEKEKLKNNMALKNSIMEKLK